MRLFPVVPPVLEELLATSYRLRAYALQKNGPFGRQAWELAERVEHDTATLIREWLDSVDPCDSCGEWCLTQAVIIEGIGLARSTLCPTCAGGTGPPTTTI